MGFMKTAGYIIVKNSNFICISDITIINVSLS